MEQARIIDETAAASVHEPVADDAEPYRLLVDAQKQVVELTIKCEQLKRECELLREQTSRETTDPVRPQSGPLSPVEGFTGGYTQKFFHAGARIFRAMEKGVTIRHKGPRDPELL